jgi:hypothetical protein
MGNRMIDRFGGACGLLSVVLIILGNDVLGVDPGARTLNASRAEIAQYVAAHPLTTANWVGLYLQVIAMLLLVVFLDRLWGVLRQGEGESGWRSTVAFGGGLLYVAVQLAALPAAIAAFYRADEGFDPQLVAALIDMNNAAWVVGWPIWALVLAATAAVVLPTRVLPRWLGWAAAAIALLLLGAVVRADAGPAVIPWVLTLGWVVVTSTVLMVRAGQPRPPAVRRSSHPAAVDAGQRS